MPRISEAQRQARRQSFIEAALDCLRTESYDRITVDQVCKRARASKGAFYLYFRSKQDLFFALVDEQSAAFERLVASMDGRDQTGPELLERFINTQLREAQDRAQVQLRADIWGMATVDAAMRERLRIATARRRAVLRRWIEQGIAAGAIPLDPKLANALASALIAVTDGLALHRGIDPRAFAWKNIRALLGALAATSAPTSDNTPRGA